MIAYKWVILETHISEYFDEINVQYEIDGYYKGDRMVKYHEWTNWQLSLDIFRYWNGGAKWYRDC